MSSGEILIAGHDHYAIALYTEQSFVAGRILYYNYADNYSCIAITSKIRSRIIN